MPPEGQVEPTLSLDWVTLTCTGEGSVYVSIRPAINNTSSDVKRQGLPAPRWTLRVFGIFELGAFPSGEKVALSGKRERPLFAFLPLSPRGRQPRRKLAA